jgi:hypothetical protein
MCSHFACDLSALCDHDQWFFIFSENSSFPRV